MPNLLPVSGHSSKLAIESFPIVPATFVDIAQLRGDLNFDMTRATEAVSPHGNKLSENVVSDLIVRGPITATINFLHDNATHDYDTGLGKHFIENSVFGLLFKGPDYAAGVDEIIVSGSLTNYSRVGPEDAGVYMASLEFLPTGAMIIDGTLIALLLP